MIYFITGSEGKYKEAKAIIEDLGQLDIDLPEVQDLDVKKIVEVKLEEAKKHYSGEFIVEDTGLYLDCLNGMPGPLIKWFLKAIGNDGIANLAIKLGNQTASAKTVIGYCDDRGVIHFFEGEMEGKIVMPRGENGFGWDVIFEADGKTYAEMSTDEKNAVSMRRKAMEQLNQYLTEKRP